MCLAQADPEQYVRAGDVEATPDADTPRPCGVALLLCMLSRREQTVAAALIQLASRLQASAADCGLLRGPPQTRHTFNGQKAALKQQLRLISHTRLTNSGPGNECLSAHCLQRQPRTPEVLQLQEACYRGLGEAFSQLRKLPGICFADWYTSELRGLLQIGDAQVRQS